MGQLHELLAVITNLEGTAKKVRDEAIVTFAKKPHLFRGVQKTLKMFDEARQAEEDGQGASEALSTTVPEKLDYVRESQEKWYDACLQLEATNQQAIADLVVDGKVLAIDLPATFLLGLESKLKALRAVIESTPTQDPGITWVVDEAMGGNIFRAKDPVKAQKTEKVMRHQVLVQPTKEHPAQIEKWQDNVPVGVFTTNIWTGTISPGKKSQYLEKIDTLIQEVKQARQRANSTEVEKKTIGKDLFDYILGD